MAQSTVKWFDPKKGYGFIFNPEGGDDIFVHYTSIISDNRYKILSQDAEVEYELDQSRERLHATSVRETVAAESVHSLAPLS